MACWSTWDISGCGCPCTVGFTVFGCNGLKYSGLTVNVYDHSGGTLLATGTTTSTGVSLTWPGTSGTYYVQVTGMSARFQSYGVNTSLTCGGAVNITLSVATGYTCYAGCLLPVANTLTFTGSLGPTCTLTYSAGAWGGTLTAGGDGFTISLDATGVITITDTSASITCPTTITGTTCPTSFLVNITIAGTRCGTRLGTTATITE